MTSTNVIPLSAQNADASQPFSADETALIYSASAETPFRVLQITDANDSVILRSKCSDIDSIADNDALRLFIARLKTTLQVEDGVGIAAPQVGVLKNVFLFIRVDAPEQPVVTVINPRIVSHSDSLLCFERDGCLSIPDVSGNSLRYPWVEVEYFDEQGQRVREKIEGYSRPDNFAAVIFQHEYDHLNGIIFTDKLCSTTRS